MDALVRDTVLWNLQEVFADIESSRELLISATVRSFITDLVIESLELRSDDWKHFGSDPNYGDNAGSIAESIVNSLREVTDEAATYKSESGLNQIPLISVVEQVHKKWCGIFPFCR